VIRVGSEGGVTYAVKSRSVVFVVAVALEGVEDFGAVFELRGADLFDAFAAKRHGAEDDGEGGFGGHCWCGGW
jgi:hypothetical protein